jgi:hypothetical protein
MSISMASVCGGDRVTAKVMVTVLDSPGSPKALGSAAILKSTLSFLTV